MNYKTLGRTRLKVSELCLGPMTFGENFFNIAVVDQSSANRMVTRALEAGINFSTLLMFTLMEVRKRS